MLLNILDICDAADKTKLWASRPFTVIILRSMGILGGGANLEPDCVDLSSGAVWRWGVLALFEVI